MKWNIKRSSRSTSRKRNGRWRPRAAKVPLEIPVVSSQPDRRLLSTWRHDPAALANGNGGHPDWNEPVVAEGESELRMDNELKGDFAIFAQIGCLI